MENYRFLALLSADLKETLPDFRPISYIEPINIPANYLCTADIDLVATVNSNTVTINENSTASLSGSDKKVTSITLIGASNTVTSTHAGAADHFYGHCATSHPGC